MLARTGADIIDKAPFDVMVSAYILELVQALHTMAVNEGSERVFKLLL